MDGGASSSNSNILGFDDNNNTNNNNSSNNILMMMMMPPPTSNTITNTAAATTDSNNIFLPLPTNSINLHHNNLKNSYFMENTNSDTSLKDKIMSHPHYPRLLTAYINCQKVGAPPEVVVKLEEACGAEIVATGHHNNNNNNNHRRSCLGEDPGLDQFMEAYCEMLTKYEQELSKPFKEAMLFLSRFESQFKSLSFAPSSVCGEVVMDRNGSSEEDVDVNINFVDPQAEDKELKGQLLRKYSGYLGSLKHEFMKKRKKGKLPKEARQQLLDWWSRHYKWPYPSESQKLALAESTGLDQKQINNWFINQRKRHWKPAEDMQFVMMDAAHPHYYMDTMLANPFPMDITPAL